MFGKKTAAAAEPAPKAPPPEPKTPPKRSGEKG